MEKRDKPNNKPEDDFVRRLFGDVAEISDEEVDLLYEALSSGEPASNAVYRAAETAAVEYRKRGVVPPDHIQAALEATRPTKGLEGAKESFLQKVIEKLGQPVTGPVGDPAYSYRSLKELTEKDRQTLDELTRELQRDWGKKEDE